MNDSESFAMWKLYLQANEGIAIQSTVGRLKQMLENCPYPCHLYPVKYVDYDTEPMGENDWLKPFFYKRMSFEHEKELRAIAMNLKIPFDMNDNSPIVPSVGLKIPISLTDLIENVYVSPTAPGWLAALVADTCQKFGFQLNVLSSRLAEPPPYNLRRNA